MGVFRGDGKIGSFWSSDNCSMVRGVLDRLITHLLVWSVHVSLGLEGGSLGAGLEAGVLVEGVVAIGVARTVDWLEDGVEVLAKLDGTFQCPLKLFCWLMFLRFTACLFRL